MHAKWADPQSVMRRLCRTAARQRPSFHRRWLLARCLDAVFRSLASAAWGFNCTRYMRTSPREWPERVRPEQRLASRQPGRQPLLARLLLRDLSGDLSCQRTSMVGKVAPGGHRGCGVVSNIRASLDSSMMVPWRQPSCLCGDSESPTVCPRFRPSTS